MRRRTAALIAATAVLGGALAATAASGAGAPPPPKATNGAAVKLVAAGLKTPTSFAFGDGAIFEGDGGSESSKGPPNGGVFVLKGGKGTKVPGSPEFVAGLVWHDGSLYVGGGTVTGPTTQKWQLFVWSGWNGSKFTTQKAIYTAPKKFNGFNGLAFGPDGRLYVGVDLGLTDGNDHGPATTSPYLYDILSLSPTGQALKVFATGMRQPWQFVFPSGSAFPLVSDLGQDKGAKNPPDFILKVHPGDDYGFPKCNWTEASACKGFAKPFAQFSPHADIMGLGIVGSELYMTSFGGITGKGPGGEVLEMPLSGGKAKPLVTGFVAPVVGLGENAGLLYIGELTGQVFSVKA
jgi:glucose/arabinose dehydrogenase